MFILIGFKDCYVSLSTLIKHQKQNEQNGTGKSKVKSVPSKCELRTSSGVIMEL